jgi:hypothetical protein
MEWKMKQLLELDYSHPWVTAHKHIVEIYEEACKHKGWALDVGTFQGHSARALHLAGLGVATMDIDSKYFAHTPFAELTYCVASERYHTEHKYAVIVHDAQHGQHMIPELVRYFGYVQSGGVLIIHDTNELNLSDLVAALGYPKNTTTADDRMRTLSMFWKP